MENNYTIGICSETYLVDGHVTFFPHPDKTQLAKRDRRISRTKTLDGGAVFIDGGVCAADRTMRIATPYNESVWTRCGTIFDNASYVRIACKEGCFRAKIQDLDEDAGQIIMTVLVAEDLTAS